MMFCMFILGMILGLAYEEPFTCVSLIFLVLLVLTLGTGFLNPWYHKKFYYSELISLTFLILNFIVFIIMAENQNKGCVYCGSRETTFCYFSVFMIFFSLLSNLTGFYICLYDSFKGYHYRTKLNFI